MEKSKLSQLLTFSSKLCWIQSLQWLINLIFLDILKESHQPDFEYSNLKISTQRSRQFHSVSVGRKMSLSYFPGVVSWGNIPYWVGNMPWNVHNIKFSLIALLVLCTWLWLVYDIGWIEHLATQIYLKHIVT